MEVREQSSQSLSRHADNTSHSMARSVSITKWNTFISGSLKRTKQRNVLRKTVPGDGAQTTAITRRASQLIKRTVSRIISSSSNGSGGNVISTRGSPIDCSSETVCNTDRRHLSSETRTASSTTTTTVFDAQDDHSTNSDMSYTPSSYGHAFENSSPDNLADAIRSSPATIAITSSSLPVTEAGQSGWDAIWIIINIELKQVLCNNTGARLRDVSVVITAPHDHHIIHHFGRQTRIEFSPNEIWTQILCLHTRSVIKDRSSDKPNASLKSYTVTGMIDDFINVLTRPKRRSVALEYRLDARNLDPICGTLQVSPMSLSAIRRGDHLQTLRLGIDRIVAQGHGNFQDFSVLIQDFHFAAKRAGIGIRDQNTISSKKSAVESLIPAPLFFSRKPMKDNQVTQIWQSICAESGQSMNSVEHEEEDRLREAQVLGAPWL